MRQKAISKNYFVFPELGKLIVFDIRNTKGLSEEKIVKLGGLDIDDLNVKILVYEDQVKTWFFDVANYLRMNTEKEIRLPTDRLFCTNEAGFIILQIAISYIEGNQQYRNGELSHGNSKPIFIKGMKRIFNKENVRGSVLSYFYDQVRCGLFHEGITKKNVEISASFDFPVRSLNGKIDINPYRFLDAVQSDFEKYCTELKDPNQTDQRTNFNLRWNLR